MEQIDKAPYFSITDEENDLKQYVTKESNEKKASHSMTVNLFSGLLLGTNLIIIIGIVLFFFSINPRIDLIKEKLNDQIEKNQVLSTQASELKQEFQNLQQYLMSKSNEDVIFLKIMIIKPDLDRKLAREIATYINHYSILYGQDPDLITAIISVESKFDPKAVSEKGAIGLMQVMPQWKKVLGISDDLSDPETSIRYGMQIFGFYTEMYKDREMALTAYNRGPGPVDMALMQGKSPTNHYAPSVMERYQQLTSMNIGPR